MGRILVAFASKTGNAKGAAKRIAGALPDCDLVDLSRQTPLLKDYDAAIIGGGVRMGSVHKDTKRFIDAHKEELMAMNCAFFITNCFEDNIEGIIAKMLPADLRAKALFSGSLGGRMDIDNLKGMDKAIAKMVSKSLEEGKAVFQALDEQALQTLVTPFLEA